MPNTPFKSWFDSPFYPILYQNRNHTEAQKFIDTIINRFKFSPQSIILDLACGRGRHSIYLNSKGFEVVGLDLSTQSIAQAKTFENDRLHFDLADMRHVWKANYFDIALNLFTSFGYFDAIEEDKKVLKAAFAMLKNDGLFLIDYLNSSPVVQKLPICETKTVQNITFQIEKKLVGDVILKTIDFELNATHHHFEEKVRTYTQQTLSSMLTETGFKVEYVAGNYDLEQFVSTKSERLIILARK